MVLTKPLNQGSGDFCWPQFMIDTVPNEGYPQSYPRNLSDRQFCSRKLKDTGYCYPFTAVTVPLFISPAPKPALQLCYFKVTLHTCAFPYFNCTLYHIVVNILKKGGVKLDMQVETIDSEVDNSFAEMTEVTKRHNV